MLARHELEQLFEITRTFYEAYKITGTVEVRFGIARIPDSDGDTLIDVYLSPQDHQSEALLNKEHAHHMQFLASMVPSSVLGYKYRVRLFEKGTELQIDVLSQVPVAALCGTQKRNR